jgi:hypothetical protein
VPNDRSNEATAILKSANASMWLCSAVNSAVSATLALLVDHEAKKAKELAIADLEIDARHGPDFTETFHQSHCFNGFHRHVTSPLVFAPVLLFPE